MKTVVAIGLVALLTFAGAVAHAATGHVHGVASLEVAIDGERLVLDFSSPLENLLGFERAPRNDKEKEAVRRLRNDLRNPELLFVPTPEAQCARVSAKVDAPALDGGKADKGGHAALAAEFVFRCARMQALTGVEAKLFDVFPRLTRLEVQVAGRRKQTAARLSPKNRRVSW